MKKYLSKIAVFALLVGALTSCEEDTVVFDSNNGQTLAGFNLKTGNLRTFEQQLNMPSELIVEVGVTTKADHDRAVQVVVNNELTDALPAQYSIDQSTFVIPAGEYTAKIRLTGYYDELTPSDRKTITLTLVSVEGADFIEPQRSSTTISLFRVCPREIPTTYTGYVTGSLGGATEEFTVVLNPTAEFATYTATNLWGNFVSGATGSNYDGQFPYPGIVTINCDNTVNVIGTSDDDRFAGGTGTFDPDTNEFQLYLNQTLFTSTTATGDVFLTPAQ
ncbi:hypothetical protein AAEO56_03645 [Flavobacterium sp. DGU11]|uniref:DUF1735 domain-containing protein n=1 Tax=Flavobacterium arundinis TaxID=3139143 RepID=A0ABU9HT55_9FLAO